MSEPRDPQRPDGGEGPDRVIAAVAGGVRMFWITAPRMQDLVSRLALVLQEHMLDDDELHVIYNAMQAGAQPHPEVPAGAFRRCQPA